MKGVAIEAKKPNNVFNSNNIRNWTPILVLLFMIVFLGIWNSSFFYSSNIVTVSILAAILLMAAIGQTWVILLGSIDLSVGSMIALGSVVFASTAHLGFNSLFLVLLIGIVGGLLNGLIFTIFKTPSFISTLGTGGIFLSLAFLISKGSTVAISDPTSVIFSFLNGSLFFIPNIVTVVLFFWAICFIFQRFTTGGRKLYFVGNSEPTAWMSGVLINRYKILAFTLSGLSASFCGVLLAGYIFNGSPTVGNSYVLLSIAVVVMGGTALTGGVGGLGKTIVGALIMAILNNGMNIVGVNAYFQDIMTGAVIIVAAMLTLDRSKISMLK